MFDVNFEFEERDEFNSSFQINTYPQKTSELINDLNFVDINYVDTAVGKIIIPSKLSELDNDAGYITLEEVPKVDTSDLATKQELNQKQDKGDYALKSEIPTQLSRLNNDVGYITLADIPDVDASDFATKEELNNKQDIINDLEAIRSGANKGATSIQPNDLSLVAKTGNYNDLLNKPTIPTKYGYSIVMSVDPTTYVGTLALKDQNGNTLGDVQTFDLPLESVVVGGSYDEVNKSVILTLKGGDTVSFSVADLVRGLQTEITDNNKLSANLVDDTNSSKKFVSESEKTLWNDKQDTISDLSTIRSNANLGATAVQPEDIPVTDVQANGTSVLVDGVANIPLATSNQAGLVRPVQANGIYVSNTGTLNLSKLSNASLVNKNSGYAVLVNQIDLATKVGVTTNTIELTDDEKTNACNWLGAGQDVKIQELSETDDITLTDNIIYNGGEQVSLAISLPNTTSVTFICNIEFTSGATATTLQYPDSIKWIGDDISDNIFTPASNKRYSVICYCNGIDYICVVKGV